MEELLPALDVVVPEGPVLLAVLKRALFGESVNVALDADLEQDARCSLEVHVEGKASSFVLFGRRTGCLEDGRTVLQLSVVGEIETAKVVEAIMALEARGTVPGAAEFSATLDAPPQRVSSTPGEALIGRKLGGGKFLIRKLLGQGAVGAVYAAHHRDLDKPVAIKILHSSYRRDPAFAGRFQREALAASKLDHGNVVRVLDFGEEPDGLLYLVMEYLDGCDLAMVIERGETLSLERILAIGSQICAGLAAAHECGVIHRDIKPANVMLIKGRDDEGNAVEIAKVSDFGIAEQLTDAEPGTTSLISGTPHYMSPEQSLGLPVDGRSDVYSCGMLLFEVATGALPFTGTTVLEVLRAQQEQVPPAPSTFWPEVDPRLERIILTAIAKIPEERYQSARELRAALRAVLERKRERREVYDLTEVVALGDEAVGFATFFVAFASAILRMGYYERGHTQFGASIARLSQAAAKTLEHRGELTFVRQMQHGEMIVTVVSGAGEAFNLTQLVPPAVGALYAEKFGDALVRRHVVSLTIRDGIDDEQLEDLVDILSGPELDPALVRKQLDNLELADVQLLFNEELLGRRRRLPWQVDLCISRVARDLATLPMLKDADAETMRTVRLQIVGDVIRPLSRPDQMRLLLDHADLIASHIEGIQELADLDVTSTLIAALSPRACVELGRYLLQEVANQRTRTAGAPTMRLGPRELLAAVARRLSQGLGDEGDALLRELYDRSLIEFADLPREVQIWIRAEETASKIADQGEEYLSRLDLVDDLKPYNHFCRLFECAMQILAQRAEVRAARLTLETLERHAADPSRSGEMRTRAQAAARSLDELRPLTAVAHTLLTGDHQQRDEARLVLRRFPATATAALCSARLKFPGSDMALRLRFVTAVRDLGDACWPVISEKLRAATTEDEEWLVDLLRAVPNVRDEECGAKVAALAAHGSPAIRRAVGPALAQLWGVRARDTLLEILAGPDDGARLTAIAGLRAGGAIDRDVVMRFDRILSGLVSGLEEVEAAAAAALADAQPEFAGAARATLARRLQPKSKSMLNALREAVASPDSESKMVVLACVRSLLALGGSQAEEIVATKIARTSGPLREELVALVRARDQASHPSTGNAGTK